MGRGSAVVVLVVGLGLGLAVPVAGQMWGFPDYALPSANGAPGTFIAGTYGRGLNDASGELDAFGGVIGATRPRASFLGGIGIVTGEGDNELTVGGGVGVDLMQAESVTLSLQGGIGWTSLSLLGEDLTFLRFPNGLALKGRAETTGAAITPWVMPRLNIARLSGLGESETETDFGASGGASITFASGFGIHTALDLLAAEEAAWTLGLGAHWVFGR